MEKCKVTLVVWISHFTTTSLQDGLIVPFGDLEKQGRPGKVRGFVQLIKFEEMPSLCPVSSLLSYLSHVSSRQTNE